jgi:soluble lytic murein transglycosylase
MRVAGLLRRDPMPVEQADLDAMLLSVDRAAKRFDIDPLTILAVIKVESGFDPFAISTAGAMGLMQLQLATAQDLATRLGIEWTHDELVFDPDVNILLGTAYLRELLDRFDNLDIALAAFHAGPNRIAARNLRLGAASLQYTDRVWDALVALHKTARV